MPVPFRALLFSLFVASATAGSAAHVCGTVLSVCPLGCDYSGLAAAVADACPGDRIEVSGELPLGAELRVDKALVITGVPGAAGTSTARKPILDLQGTGSIHIDASAAPASVTVTQLTLLRAGAGPAVMVSTTHGAYVKLAGLEMPVGSGKGVVWERPMGVLEVYSCLFNGMQAGAVAIEIGNSPGDYVEAEPGSMNVLFCSFIGDGGPMKAFRALVGEYGHRVNTNGDLFIGIAGKWADFSEDVVIFASSENFCYPCSEQNPWIWEIIVLESDPLLPGLPRDGRIRDDLDFTTIFAAGFDESPSLDARGRVRPDSGDYKWAPGALAPGDDPSVPPYATAVPTLPPTEAPTPTVEATATPVATSTPMATATFTPAATAIETPTFTMLDTPVPTAAETATPVTTPTAIETPTFTMLDTPVPTAAETATPVATPTAVASPVPTNGPTAVPTSVFYDPTVAEPVTEMIPVPNPNPTSLSVLLAVPVEEVEFRYYTSSGTLIGEGRYSPGVSGWYAVPLSPGTFEYVGLGYASVQAYYRGTPYGAKKVTLMYFL